MRTRWRGWRAGRSPRRTLPDWQLYEYERIIPAGTRYPTPGAGMVRHYGPSFGGQDTFALPICELGRFGWEPLRWERRGGSEYWRPQQETDRQRVVCLNEADPDIPLTPPAGDEKTRLRVTYRVDDQRRLRVTVHDLRRKANLMTDQVVAELR